LRLKTPTEAISLVIDSLKFEYCKNWTTEFWKFLKTSAQRGGTVQLRWFTVEVPTSGKNSELLTTQTAFQINSISEHVWSIETQQELKRASGWRRDRERNVILASIMKSTPNEAGLQLRIVVRPKIYTKAQFLHTKMLWIERAFAYSFWFQSCPSPSRTINLLEKGQFQMRGANTHQLANHIPYTLCSNSNGLRLILFINATWLLSRHYSIANSSPLISSSCLWSIAAQVGAWVEGNIITQ